MSYFIRKKILEKKAVYKKRCNFAKQSPFFMSKQYTVYMVYKQKVTLLENSQFYHKYHTFFLWNLIDCLLLSGCLSNLLWVWKTIPFRSVGSCDITEPGVEWSPLLLYLHPHLHIWLQMYNGVLLQYYWVLLQYYRVPQASKRGPANTDIHEERREQSPVQHGWSPSRTSEKLQRRNSALKTL